MFNQMALGNGDPEIVAAKLVKMHVALNIIRSVTKDFAGGPLFRAFPEHKSWQEEFATFSTLCEPLLKIDDYKVLGAENHIKQIILVCKELVDHKHYILEKPASDKWITSAAGLSYEPFAFTKLDLKGIWLDPKCSPSIKKYILMAIQILFQRCSEVYELKTSPDIDSKAFSEAIVKSIEKIKTIPQLSRCKRAFKQIAESVSLLETNFQDYYRDMSSSGNPNTMIESFLIDVSKNKKLDATIMHEFRQIINFYKEQNKGKKHANPKMQKLMQSLSERLDS